jgi:hypothetical protein
MEDGYGYGNNNLIIKSGSMKPKKIHPNKIE